MPRSPYFFSLLLGLTTTTACFGDAFAQEASHAEAASPGPGDAVETCIEQHRSAQVLLGEGRLIESRAQLLACSMKRCPALLRRDCDAFLKKAEAELPSVVIAATGPDGRGLHTVRVTVDGVVVAEELEGQALSVDPGMRVFGFTLPDGTQQSVEVLIQTGQKFRQIPVSFRPLIEDQPKPQESFEVPAVAWILGGVGVASLGVAAVLYFPTQDPEACLRKHAEASDDERYASDFTQQRIDCDGDDWNSVQDRYLYTNIAVISGAALLAGAAVATIWVNVGSEEARLAPQIGFDGSKILVRGRF